jgi:hypothetical protein
VVIDAAGDIRLNHFGALDDLALGGLLGRLTQASSSGGAPRSTNLAGTEALEALELDCSEAGCQRT